MAGSAVDALQGQNRDRAALPQELHPVGVRKLLIRHGYSCQVPARRAVERDEDQVTGWVKETWPAGGSTAAALDAWIVFEDESGFSLTPPIAYTWARRGRTRVIRVPGRSRRRISIAALTCYGEAGCPTPPSRHPSTSSRPSGTA
uniref:winged helix-turn-helix domain-containing protein n=1 Tax=Streptomyces canus TaxID=58343 RepID=UPI00384ED3DF